MNKHAHPVKHTALIMDVILDQARKTLNARKNATPEKRKRILQESEEIIRLRVRKSECFWL